MNTLRQKAIAIEDEARRCGLIAHYLGDYHASHTVPQSKYWDDYCINTIYSHDEVKVSLNGKQRNIRARNLDALLDNLRALQNGDKKGAAALLWVPS